MSTLLQRCDALQRQLEDPACTIVEDIVTTILEELDGTVTTANVYMRCVWIDVLASAANRSDRALARIVEALADEDGFDRGSSPYNSYWETVQEHAMSALYPLEIRSRARPFVVQLLSRTSSAYARSGAERVLAWCDPSS